VRASTLDIVVQTGALWTRDVQLFKPDAPVAVQAVTPGSRVFVDGVPLLVHTVTPVPGGRTTLAFGHGLINDAVATFPSTALIAPAVPVELVAVEAAYTAMVVDEPGYVESVPIPASVAPDGLTATLELDADTTALMGDYEGTHSWDCYALTLEWDWQRILEGTLTVIRGDAR
jgi:hypothetical protein